jgi:hypothetical protein
MDVEQQLAVLRRMTDQLLSSPPGDGVNETEVSAKDFVLRFRALDLHLSGGGVAPEAWVEGPDAPELGGRPVRWEDDADVPEGFGIIAHWSQVHEGVNVEMDVPNGLRVTVHYNEWLAVDSVAGIGTNDGEPLPSTEVRA